MGNIVGQFFPGDNQQNQAGQGAGAGGINWNGIWDGVVQWIENWWQIIVGVVVFIIIIIGLYFAVDYFIGEEEEVKLNFTETNPGDRKDIMFGTANAATLAYSLYRLAKMLLN